jgi:hypothetical protein
LGNSSSSRPKEVPIGLWHEVARVGEDGAPPIPGEPHALLGLWSFGDSGIVFSVRRLGGLPTFGDSLPTGALFAKKVWVYVLGHSAQGFTSYKIVNEEK